MRADLSDPLQACALVDQVIAQFGRVDVLVNNAGIYEAHPVLTSSSEEWRDRWRRTIDTNLIGPANLIHAVVPHMVRTGGGRIVNVSSRGAFRGEPDHAAYGASKAGLNSLGQSMARALAPHGIYVTTVAPGFVETDMAAPYLEGPAGEAIRAQSPMNRAATPEEMTEWQDGHPVRDPEAVRVTRARSADGHTRSGRSCELGRGGQGELSLAESRSRYGGSLAAVTR